MERGSGVGCESIEEQTRRQLRTAALTGGQLSGPLQKPDADMPGPDPWKHRSCGMRCASCMWFVIKEATRAQYGPARTIGRCRRHSPTMNGYPVVFTDDWCGDHKLDEQKQ